MKAPKIVRESEEKMSEEMAKLETQKPFDFPTRSMSDDEKKIWDDYAARWNGLCEKEGKKCLSLISSNQASI